MTRIFVGLALVNALALLASAAVGFFSDGRATAPPGEPLTAAQQAFAIHWFGGVLAAVLTLLVHSVVFVYLMGTGRWTDEVVKAYRLPESLWNESRRLKTRVLPFFLGGVGLVIATTTLGAAADVGMLKDTFHLLLALTLVAFTFWSYFVEYEVVRSNGELLSRIMDEVTRMRRERGLC